MDNARSLPLDPPPPRPLGAHSERRDRGGLRRMRDVRFAEIAYRGWQEASKWLERQVPQEPLDHPEALLRRHAPELADKDSARRLIREVAPQRFFAGVDNLAAITVLAARLPGYRRDVLASAEAGTPWSGDKELIRHQWLVRLAQARVLSGDESYAERTVRSIEDWIATHPPGAGVDWDSNGRISSRMISWCWALMLLRDAPALHGTALTRILASLWQHATHVRRHLSYYCSPNPRLAAEALGLFYVSVLFPEFRDAPRWKDVAVRILVGQAETQIYGDGVHVEQSTCYHRYAVDSYLHFILLAARNNVDIPAAVADRVRRMIDFLLTISQPDGTVPAIGDDDGGLLLPLASRATGDSRGVFGVGAAIFRRPDYAWGAGGLGPEVLWLMGDEGARAFDGIRTAPPLSAASRVFPTGGYAVMRSGWEDDAHKVIVDIGPLGCPVSGGHGHADLLSVQCSIFGEPCIVDSGTFAYGADPAWRDFFRSTAAHSTVMIDGQSQAEAAGPFGWRRQPRVKLREWHSTPEFDFLDAEHDGYLTLPDPVIHRRRVIFVKPNYWILIDDLSGRERHQIDLTFQFGPLDVALGPHPWARARTANGRVLWVSPFPSAPVHPSLKTGETAPIRGWISTAYGQRQPAPLLNYGFAVALPWRIVTVLLPDRQGSATPPAVRGIYDDAGMPTGVAFDRPRRSVRFDDHAVSVERD